MLLKEYEQLVASPQKATRYIQKLCWPNYQRFCPKCKSRKLKQLPNEKRKCLKCNYSFNDYSLRYFGTIRTTPDNWLRIIKLFEMEVQVEEMAYQLGLSPNTIRKAITSIRLAIVDNSLDGNLLLKHFQLNLLLKGKKLNLSSPPVFGLIEHENKVYIDFLPDLDMESFIHLKLNFQLPSQKIGSVIYTAPIRQYLSLLIYDQKITQKYQLKHSSQHIPLNGNKNFWPFAKRRLANFRTTNSLNFLLYLKELEFRYNFKSKDFFNQIARYLAKFIEDNHQK